MTTEMTSNSSGHKYFWSTVAIGTAVAIYFLLQRCQPQRSSGQRPTDSTSSTEVPKDLPKSPSKDLPQEVPEEIPQDPSNEAPKKSPEEVPEEIPKDPSKCWVEITNTTDLPPAPSRPAIDAMSAAQCELTLLRSHVSMVIGNKGQLTHAYYQQNDGSISVVYKSGPFSSDPNWGGGDNTIVLAAGKALMHTPLATTQWEINGAEYRTCYLNNSFEICENMLSPSDGGKWHDGDLNSLKATAAPYSKLAVISWTTGGAPHIRVYYQGTDDKIHELCYEGGWSHGATLPGTPLHGTSLSFVQRSTQGTPSIRGYYQENDRTLNEVCWDGGWSLGTHIGSSPFPYRGAIAATVPKHVEDQWIRVYYMNWNDQIAEYYWNAGWHGPANLSSHHCVPDGQLAAVSAFRDDGYTSQPDVRILLQSPYCIWSELSCKKGEWSGSLGLKGVPIKMVPIS